MNDRTKKSNNEYIENIMININRLDIYLCSNRTHSSFAMTDTTLSKYSLGCSWW